LLRDISSDAILELLEIKIWCYIF